METRLAHDADEETGAGTDWRSPARLMALGAAAALGLTATAALWYLFAHGKDGYVTWSRREETDDPEGFVTPTLSRSPDTDGVAPPF